MFLDPAQTLVGARVWENVEVIMPRELDTSGRSPTTFRPQPRMAEGLPQENRAFSACVGMGGVM